MTPGDRELGHHPQAVAVRDSKDPAGPALTFTPAAWRACTARLSRDDTSLT